MSSIDDLLDMFEIDYFLQQNHLQIGPTISAQVAENWHRKLYDRLQTGKRTFPCAAMLSFKEEFATWKTKKVPQGQGIAEMRLRHLRREQEKRRALEPFADRMEQKKQALHLIFSGLTGNSKQDSSQLVELFKSQNLAPEPQEAPLDLAKPDAPILAKTLSRTPSLPPPLPAPPLKMSQLQLQLQAQPFSTFQPQNFGPFPISQHLNGPRTSPRPHGGVEGSRKRKRKMIEQKAAPIDPALQQLNNFHSNQMLQTLINRRVDPWMYQNWERLTPLQKYLIYQAGTGQMIHRQFAQLSTNFGKLGAPGNAPGARQVPQSSPEAPRTPKTNFRSIEDMVDLKKDYEPPKSENFKLPAQNANSKLFPFAPPMSREQFMDLIMNQATPTNKKLKANTEIPVYTIN